MKSGLLIEGGGARGFFAAGILQILAQEGIHFPYSIGISSGSLNSLLYQLAIVDKPFPLQNFFSQHLPHIRFKNLFRPNEGLIQIDQFFKWLPDVYPNLQTISDQHQIAAVKASTGELEYWPLAQGENATELQKRIQASCSIPILMPKMSINNEVYVDGGIRDSIPIKKALSDGLDKIVLILSRKAGYQKKPQAIGPYLKHWLRDYKALELAMRNRHLHYNEALSIVSTLEREGKIFVFRPERHRLRRFEFNQRKSMQTFEDGAQMARNRLDELKKYLASPPSL